MKKQWLFACMAALLLTHTSCRTDEMPMEAEIASIESRSYMAERQVQELTQQARYGEVEAYKSLAYCYRDGKGVEKSYMNAMFMYGIYCQKTGQELESIINLFEKGNPCRLLIEIFSSPEIDKDTKMKIDELQHSSPAEAKVITTMIDFFSNDSNNVLEALREAELMGSELAKFIQAFYYKEKKDKTKYYQSLIRAAEKHPFLYTKIAETYEEKYDMNEDFSNIQKAMEYYYKADSLAMLTPRQANNLWSIYDYFSQKGLLEYDKPEVERLKKIIKTENSQ